MLYGKRNKANTIRVEWWSEATGVVVKFYNTKTFNDIKPMRGFEPRKIESLQQSNYTAECKAQQVNGGYQWNGGAA